MNRYRRKELDSIIKTLGALYYELEDLSSKETDAYENLPESLQQAQKGEMILEAADNINNACEAIEEVITFIENAMEC